MALTNNETSWIVFFSLTILIMMIGIYVISKMYDYNEAKEDKLRKEPKYLENKIIERLVSNKQPAILLTHLFDDLPLTEVCYMFKNGCFNDYGKYLTKNGIFIPFLVEEKELDQAFESWLKEEGNKENKVLNDA